MSEFADAVNMTALELKRWLNTDESSLADTSFWCCCSVRPQRSC
ncbi:DUF3140 domain-containing protein [Lentzea sp. BCCO 10_0856]|uniref:DUF3140 domain-containing protein n=1 Tax=Lentzea miocenica TaxID=3095431 RepID=A0ABU4SZS2_9PSEU|nr:DUF3140 domain-containing protein [Lentzea sp. BCCO 10_0856]MDX8031412.1 DUF3140 domain-containing protein [Lentzea sp. BCCO 10_0856]